MWAMPKIKAEATMENPMPYFRRAESTTPRKGELLHKGHQHGGDGNVQQHHLEGFPRPPT